MNVQEAAQRIAEALGSNGFGDQPDRQALALAEEVGEFVGAWRRWRGQARRGGTLDEVRTELADVVITAYVLDAEYALRLDDAIQEKLKIVFSRGWREEVR